MSDNVFLNFRMKREDRDRLQRVAAANHLSPTIWARQQLLRAVEAEEKRDEAALKERFPLRELRGGVVEETPAVPFDGAEAGP